MKAKSPCEIAEVPARRGVSGDGKEGVEGRDIQEGAPWILMVMLGAGCDS